MPSRLSTTRARYSRFTWWQIPVPGGTTLKSRSEPWPQRRNAYRSRFRSTSSSTLRSKANREANSSTCTEWSITSSAGISGLIFPGSPPSSAIASRIAARSTTAGTPVKSCSSTREGKNEISCDGAAPGSHDATARAPASSPERSVFSSSTRSV